MVVCEYNNHHTAATVWISDRPRDDEENRLGQSRNKLQYPARSRNRNSVKGLEKNEKPFKKPLYERCQKNRLFSGRTKICSPQVKTTSLPWLLHWTFMYTPNFFHLGHFLWLESHLRLFRAPQLAGQHSSMLPTGKPKRRQYCMNGSWNHYPPFEDWQNLALAPHSVWRTSWSWPWC